MRIDEARRHDHSSRIENSRRGYCLPIADERDSIAGNADVDAARIRSGSVNDGTVSYEQVNSLLRLRRDRAYHERAGERCSRDGEHAQLFVVDCSLASRRLISTTAGWSSGSAFFQSSTNAEKCEIAFCF